MTLLGVDGVFSSVRIQNNTLPEGFYHYELTAGKDSRFGAVQEKRVFRHAGDFISKEPLPLGAGNKRALTEEDWLLDVGRKFEFESFWEHKLSINKQISNAQYKRDLAMGKTPQGRDPMTMETLEQSM